MLTISPTGWPRCTPTHTPTLLSSRKRQDIRVHTLLCWSFGFALHSSQKRRHQRRVGESASVKPFSSLAAPSLGSESPSYPPALEISIGYSLPTPVITCQWRRHQKRRADRIATVKRILLLCAGAKTKQCPHKSKCPGFLLHSEWNASNGAETFVQPNPNLPSSQAPAMSDRHE
jgi:hypothetical protein